MSSSLKYETVFFDNSEIAVMSFRLLIGKLNCSVGTVSRKNRRTGAFSRQTGPHYRGKRSFKKMNRTGAESSQCRTSAARMVPPPPSNEKRHAWFGEFGKEGSKAASACEFASLSTWQAQVSAYAHANTYERCLWRTLSLLRSTAATLLHTGTM
jgi:hypothetical protein